MNARAGEGSGAREGRKSSTVTAIAIMAAFLEKGTWPQRKLAVRVGITPRQLRRHLETLRETHGWPLGEIGGRTDRTWCLPVGWVPGGVLVPQELAADIVRLLIHARPSKVRDRLLQRLEVSVHPPPGEAVVAPVANAKEDEFLPLVHQAARDKVPLFIRYRGTSDGLEKPRHVSIQRILADGDHTRLLAVCHKAHDLRTFRVDRIAQARLDRAAKFLFAAEADVRRKIEESFSGMHEGEPAQELWFFVKNPAARWVADSLPPGMKAEPTVGGIRVMVKTSSPRMVARYVLGLGKDVVPEHEALRKIVRKMALEALEACDEAVSSGGIQAGEARSTPTSS